MSDAKGAKLNQLQQAVPEGLLVDAAWLQRRGYPNNLRNRYVHSGWLEPLAYGLYRRPPPRLRATPPDQIPWTLVVVSLQMLMEWPGVVGGRTALTLQGYGHYLEPEGPRVVHLYGDQPPPGWLSRLNIRQHFVFHRASRLFPADKTGKELDAVVVDVGSGVTTRLPKGYVGGPPESPLSPTSWPITCSTPERAILELLDELPERESFEQVDKIFQSLSNLNPRACQRLLGSCSKVKVKRLFLWFAERHGHRWLERVQRDRIDLGKGKRLIAKQGRLNRKYQITVPEDLNGTV
jgi:hypothetical protein